MVRELSQRERVVLIELLKNAKLSDRELAAKLNASQPTVTRIRNKLFENGFFSKYTILPSLSSAGLNLMAFTFFRRINTDTKKGLFEFIRQSACTVFCAEGEGLREQTLIMITVHSDFDKFEQFMRGIRNKFDTKVEGISTFFVPVKSTVKDFDLTAPVEDALLKAKPKRGISVRRVLERAPIPQLPKQFPFQKQKEKK